MDVMKSKISEHEGGSLVEVVTDEDGDVYIEGSQRQVKRLLK